MALGPFIWGEGGQKLTPEQVAQRRKQAELASLRAGDTSPVGHWTQGAARVVDALGGVLNERRADRAEEAGLAGADDYVANNPVLASLIGSGGSGVSYGTPLAATQPSMPAGADDIRAGLIARGLPEHVADGFIMNFQDESGLNPGINEQNPLVPGSRGGFGLAQWTGPRRRALEAFAQQRGTPVSDTDTQLDFLMQELQGPEAAAAQSIFGAEDAGSAAAAIVNQFLRPAEEHRARRVAEYTGGQGYAPQQQEQGSNVVAALAGAMSDPWVAQKYGPVLEALMGQQMKRGDMDYQAQLQANDPLRQAQIDKIYGRNGATGGGTEYGLAPQYGVNEAGDPVLFQIGKDGTTVQTPLPEGVSLSRDPIRIDAGTHYVLLDPVTRQPVGQVDKNIRDAAAEGKIGEAEGEATGKAVANLDALTAQSQGAMGMIRDIMADPALDGITGMLQGRLPPMSQAGTDLNVRIGQLKGNVFLEAYERLKGGGVITDFEGNKAEAAMARLDRVQSPQAYREALQDLYDVLEAGTQRLREKAGVQGGNAPASTGGADIPTYNPATGAWE